MTYGLRQSIADYTPMEQLRFIVNHLNKESEKILDTLPTTQAIIDYYNLWQTYDTDYLEGIEECIKMGDSPQPLLDFINKHNLKWDVSWITKETS